MVWLQANPTFLSVIGMTVITVSVILTLLFLIAVVG